MDGRSDGVHDTLRTPMLASVLSGEVASCDAHRVLVRSLRTPLRVITLSTPWGVATVGTDSQRPQTVNRTSPPAFAHRGADGNAPRWFYFLPERTAGECPVPLPRGRRKPSTTAEMGRLCRPLPKEPVRRYRGGGSFRSTCGPRPLLVEQQRKP